MVQNSDNKRNASRFIGGILVFGIFLTGIIIAMKKRKSSLPTSPKPKPVKQTTKNIKQLEGKVIVTYLSLALGLWATATWAYSMSSTRGWITCFVVGSLSFLFCLYVMFLNRWKKYEVLNTVASMNINYMILYLGFISLGAGLVQTPLKIWAIPSFAIGYAILIVGTAFSLVKGISLMSTNKS